MAQVVLEGQRTHLFQESPSGLESHHVLVNQCLLEYPVDQEGQFLLFLLWHRAFQAFPEWTDHLVLGVQGDPEVPEGLFHPEGPLVPLDPGHLVGPLVLGVLDHLVGLLVPESLY